MYYIYKYVYRGEIIYIGKTKRDLSERIYEHSVELKFLPYLNESKILYFELPTQVEMDIYEKYFINIYMPKLNVVDTDGAVFSFQIKEPKWKEFIGKSFQNKVSPASPANKTDMKRQQLQHQLQELESRANELQNFESWLEWLFEQYVETGLDIRSGYVHYIWDMDANPLPDIVTINDKNYSCFISSKQICPGKYENRISEKILREIMADGKEYSEAAYMQVRSEILDIEYQIERL